MTAVSGFLLLLQSIKPSQENSDSEKLGYELLGFLKRHH